MLRVCYVVGRRTREKQASTVRYTKGVCVSELRSCERYDEEFSGAVGRPHEHEPEQKMIRKTLSPNRGCCCRCFYWYTAGVGYHRGCFRRVCVCFFPWRVCVFISAPSPTRATATLESLFACDSFLSSSCDVCTVALVQSDEDNAPL